MGGNRTVTIHRAPCGQKAYVQWGAAWFPKGIVDVTAITAPVTFSLQHNTFCFGLGRPGPCWPACVNPLQVIPSTPVTASHMTQGTNPCNLEVRTRGWIYGRQDKGMLYLNVALEKVIRDLEIETKGTIHNRSTQIPAYADDDVIVGRSIDVLK